MIETADVATLVALATADRRAGCRTGPGHDAEVEIERRFRASEHLAVYGTLAPGRSNHHVIAHLGGDWREGYVEGERSDHGWGATHGYPGLRWVPGDARVAVRLLASPALSEAWPEIDRFEGSDYRRVLAPVHVDTADGRRLIAVANVYEVRPTPGQIRTSSS